MPIWDDTWEALMLIRDDGERWAVLEALREYGKSCTIPEGLNDIQKAVFLASKHGVKFKKKAGAPTGNSNASKNNDETTLNQYCFNVETIENNSFNNKNINNKEEEDKEEEKKSSSSSNLSDLVVTTQPPLTDFDKLCDEMLTASGTFSEKVRMLNPKYNVPNEKFDGWVQSFRHYKHTVGEDGLKSRNDVRRNFINWLPAQIRAEESGQTAQVSAEDIAFTEEQKKVIAAHCHPVQLFQATADLVRYCTKNKLPPERAVSDFAEAIENSWGYFELQAIIRKGDLLPKTRKDGKRIGTAKN